MSWQGPGIGPFQPGLSWPITLHQNKNGEWRAGPAIKLGDYLTTAGTGKNGDHKEEKVLAAGQTQNGNSFRVYDDYRGVETSTEQWTIEVDNSNRGDQFKNVNVYVCTASGEKAESGGCKLTNLGENDSLTRVDIQDSCQSAICRTWVAWEGTGIGNLNEGLSWPATIIQQEEGHWYSGPTMTVGGYSVAGGSGFNGDSDEEVVIGGGESPTGNSFSLLDDERNIETNPRHWTFKLNDVSSSNKIHDPQILTCNLADLSEGFESSTLTKIPNESGVYKLNAEPCHGTLCEVFVTWEDASVGLLAEGVSWPVTIHQKSDGSWLSGPVLKLGGYFTTKGKGNNGDGNKEAIIGGGETPSGNYFKILDDYPGVETNSAEWAFQLENSSSKSSFANIKVYLLPRNLKPVAKFKHSPKKLHSNQDVNFDASESIDKDGEIKNYRWSFGDGFATKGKSPTHKFTESGTYEVKLTVIDNNGGKDIATRTITIKNQEPVPRFNYSPTEPKTGQEITFDASQSVDRDGTINEYRWDLNNDGRLEKTVSRVNYNYYKPGTYTLKLTVSDSDGASASTKKQIKVQRKQEIKEEVKIKDKYALVVGITNYEHDTIIDLEYPAQDASDFYQFLVSDKYEEFSKDNVTLLTNEGATTQAIEREMSQLVMEVDENDLVIIFYSGHGAPGPDKNEDEDDGYDEYFVTYDTDTSTGANLYTTGISDDQFGNWLTSMDSRQVAIFIDSCYAGGATKSAKGTSIPGQKALPNNEVFNDFSFENRLLFAASKEDQPSWESPKLHQGVFTHFLLKGLKGEADGNNDGQITSDELYDYLRPQVSNYVDEHFTSTQTPLMKGEISAPLAEKQGKLQGKVENVVGDKQKASRGDFVMLNLGSKDGIKKGDYYRVYLGTKAVEAVEKVHGKVKVIEVVGHHLALAKIVEGRFEVEAGDEVEKINGS